MIHHNRIARLLTLLLAAPALATLAAEPRSAHTYRLAEGEAAPPATIDAARLLVGAWEGTAFGSRFEETWNPPSANTMVGMFKLFDGDDVAFYELMLIAVDDGTLSLKVKHFNADFSAWEEKADFAEFRLVKVDEDALHFSGLSFYRRGENAMDAYMMMRGADGVREEKLVFTRRD